MSNPLSRNLHLKMAPANQGQTLRKGTDVSWKQSKSIVFVHGSVAWWGHESNTSANKFYRRQPRHWVWSTQRELLVQYLQNFQKQSWLQAESREVPGNSSVSFKSWVMYYFLEEKKSGEFWQHSSDTLSPPPLSFWTCLIGVLCN